LKKTIKALLLAAGYGSRLRPLTDSWPKCLMPISGRPLLEYWIEILRSSKVSKVIVNTHYGEIEVKEFLQRDRYVSFVTPVSEPHLLGTAGTVRENRSWLGSGTTLLAHADNWSHCEWHKLIEFHHNARPRGTVITMMTFRSDAPSLCGIVEIDGNGVVAKLHEKVKNPPSDLANGAVYLFGEEVFDFLEQNPEVTDFSTEVLPSFIGRIATWENSGIHRDIGSIASLVRAQSDIGCLVELPEPDEWQRQFQTHPIHAELEAFVASRTIDESS
jgi:mannose-1-phosphate guanylyltransferase